MAALSSNHFSHDQQVADVINFVLDGDNELEQAFTREFPEYTFLKWEGSWVDAEASEVDPEYMQWVTDWIECHTDVYWEDGEPWYDEPHELSLIIPIKVTCPSCDNDMTFAHCPNSWHNTEPPF